MKVLRIKLIKYNWAITVLVNCSCADISEILLYLDSVLCPDNLKSQALSNLKLCALNTGLTYSNYILRRSIIVLNLSSSYAESINTIVHECYHFVLHIKETNYIQNEEALATLAGNLSMEICEFVRAISRDSN